MYVDDIPTIFLGILIQKFGSLKLGITESSTHRFEKENMRMVLHFLLFLLIIAAGLFGLRGVNGAIIALNFVSIQELKQEHVAVINFVTLLLKPK